MKNKRHVIWEDGTVEEVPTMSLLSVALLTVLNPVAIALGVFIGLLV